MAQPQPEYTTAQKAKAAVLGAVAKAYTGVMWAGTAVAVAPAVYVGGVTLAGYYSAKKYLWPTLTDRLDKYQGAPCGEGEFRFASEDGGNQCVPLDQLLTVCGEEIYGNPSTRVLYCSKEPLATGDLIYTADIRQLIELMRADTAKTAPPAVAAAVQQAQTVQQAEVAAKEQVVQQVQTQAAQVASAIDATQEQATAKIDQLDAQMTAALQQQAVAPTPAAAAAAGEQAANLNTQIIQTAAEATTQINQRGADLARTEAVAQTRIAAIEAKTEAALGHISRTVPVMDRRANGPLNLRHRGRRTTVHLAQRTSPVKKVGRNQYYVMTRRTKRCKKGFKQGVSKKGRRTCRKQ